MNNNNVFNCPNCKIKFDQSRKIPLTLSCGHIICKECLSISDKLVCPIDNTIIRDKLSSIPICHTILQHLPSKNATPKFICKCGGSKPLEFSCLYDNESFCGPCSINHNSFPHKIVKFNSSIKKIISEIELVRSHSMEKFKEINEKVNKLSEMKIFLIDSVKEEIKKLNIEVNKIIEDIMKYKNKLEEKIVNFYEKQNNQIEKYKIDFSDQNKKVTEITRDINIFLDKFNDKQILVYDDMIKDKNQIFFTWENILQNYSVLDLSIVNNRDISMVPKVLFPFKKNQNNFEILVNLEFKMKNYSFYKNNVNNDINSQNYLSDSTRENTRKSHPSEEKKQKKSNYSRKNSEPSKQNRKFIVDCKGEDKPIVLNINDNYQYIINSLQTETSKSKTKNKIVFEKRKDKEKMSYSH